MKILGISAHYHDSAATLIVDGEIRGAAQEERFTRKKHDEAFPEKAIQWCLSSQGLKVSELDAVVYYEKPLLKFDRILETYIDNVPFGLKHFVESFPEWIKNKLFLRQQLEKILLGMDPEFKVEKLLFSEHHLSHAASAFYPSPFQEALVLTLDGVGEWATSSVALGKGSDLQIIKETHFPHSLGFLYSALTTFCGFKVNSGEYKLMGLAPYGEPRFFDSMMDQLLVLNDDGSFHLNLKYFDFIKGQSMFSARMVKLLGVSPRTPESLLEPVHMDIAASIQKVLEHVLLHMIRALHRQYPHENLCLAGGVALNCVANSRLLKEGPFKKIWVQPAAGDAGGSLGGALAAYHLHYKKDRHVQSQDSMKGAYLGPSFSEEEIEQELHASGLVYERSDHVHGEVAQALSQGQSVGWFQGPMEFGPRALGARSILADARHPEMQKKLNLQIKFRESFRPFAPLILEEHVSEWFDFSEASPYMLFVAHVKESRRKESGNPSLFGIEKLNQVRSEIPAVTHVDYSARLQTVSESRNPWVYPLLKEFKKLTGCPVLVNTSFNVRGEPVVGAPKDAIQCFMGTDLDVLAMGSFIARKEKQDPRLKEEYYKKIALD